MSLYPVIEAALIGVIGIVSVYHVIRIVMPRFIEGARASVAQRLGRGVSATSWRYAVASKARHAAPESACGTGCSSGCHGCSVAARTGTSASSGDQTLR